MLLFLDHGVFYEFVDMKSQQIYTLKDVRVGVPYELVISTCAGMRRYRIGDIVQFTCIEPYRIRVAGRTKNYLNTFGEHVSVSNIDESIALVSQEMACRVQEYMIGSFEDQQ